MKILSGVIDLKPGSSTRRMLYCVHCHDKGIER